MTRKKKSMIGFDPLAWLADDESNDDKNAGHDNKDEINDDKISAQDSSVGAAEDILILQSIQDISKSELLKQQITTLIKDSKHIQIDASDVGRVDGSALQLLCALFVYAKAHDIQLSWIKPSEAMRVSAQYLGMKEQLSLD
jgi:anti-anti-sigma regulatory factor